MCDGVGGFARPLRVEGAVQLSGLSAARLVEHGQQGHPSIRRQPVSHAGLLTQQMEPQFADLAVKVTGVRFTERLWLDPISERPAMHLSLRASRWVGHPGEVAATGGQPSRLL